MKTDLPEFKRCCFCIPLRYGLLTFGYIRLISSLPLVAILIFMIHIFFKYIHSTYVTIWDLVLAITVTLVILVDAAFTIVFLVGGHQKSIKLLRVFYIYSIVMLCITTLVLTLSCILQSIMYLYVFANETHGFVYATFPIFAQIAATVANIGLEAYFILLIRSEIKKLQNSYNFRFSNLLTEQSNLENGTAPVQEISLQDE